MQDFYCTLPTSTDYPRRHFLASESTAFDTLTNAVYTSLSFVNVHFRPPLTFKLSTDPENAPWENLDSPEDWAHAIRLVYNEKARHRGKARHNINLKIGVSNMVRCFTIPTLTSPLTSLNRMNNYGLNVESQTTKTNKQNLVDSKSLPTEHSLYCVSHVTRVSYKPVFYTCLMSRFFV